MSKQITNTELAEIVSTLLTNPGQLGEEMTRDAFANFMTGIARAVCEACGGEVRANGMADNVFGEWLVGISNDGRLPADGGVWRGHDPEGEI